VGREEIIWGLEYSVGFLEFDLYAAFLYKPEVEI
jgi:hypothetical protein